MVGAATGGAARVPVRGADSFLIALDAFMRRSGQGAQISQSVLELEGLPDMVALRGARGRLVEKHPLLFARLRRSWRTWIPYWEVPSSVGKALPLHAWSELGTTGRLGDEVKPVADISQWLQSLTGRELSDGCNAALDVLELRSGSCLVALSWMHLLIDGKGAELLLAEIADLCAGIESPADPPEPAVASTPIADLVARSKPAIHRLTNLKTMRFASLGGPKPRHGRLRHEVLTLDATDSAFLRQRVDELSGGLFPMTFYVAVAARAHDAVLRHRNTAVDGFLASVPVQTRKRGARGPLFHNHVHVLFFAAHREALRSLESACAAMKQQFGEMTRAGLHESFAALLELMMRLPAWLFMRVVRFQFRGEISSFFHSHTGAFAPELQQFAGARITNAYHLPCLGSPPGTGLFFNESGDRVNVVFAWREGALKPDELALTIAQTREDLLGKPLPAEAHAL
ncbi:MAG TPA: hypothetical protein VGO90_15535 [Chthoniobacteraceae bacterium]|nr:hypothetical protein [Chthoniobacteraceae bacterium]